MPNNILKKTAIVLALSVFLGAPTVLRAQTQQPPATDKKTAPAKSDASDKKPSAGPFHGKLAAVDKSAKTITVGKRVFLITSETKMFKADKPATLDQGIVGEECSGYVKPNADGKLVATKVNFGPKPSSATKTPDTKKQ